METYPKTFPDIKPDEDIPPISEDIKIELATRYMRSYKKITGLDFKAEVEDINQRILKNLKDTNYL